MGGVGVVFVGIDLLRQLILLAVNLGFLRGGKLSAVCDPVSSGFLVDARLFGFEVGGFTRGELSTLHALRDTILLIFLALRDVRRSRLALRKGNRCRHQQRGRQNTPLGPLRAHEVLSFIAFCLR
jgi:hypothetical protein